MPSEIENLNARGRTVAEPRGYSGAVRVGSLFLAKKATSICATGEVGFVYEVYDRNEMERNGRWGYGIIFERGRYYGWAPYEVESFLHDLGLHYAPLREYRFENVLRLIADYSLGKFDAAFHAGREAVNLSSGSA